MRRANALVLSLALGIAAVAGTVAATRTAALGARASDSQIEQRTARLDRFETALDKAARDRPPALPALRAAAQAPSPAPPRVVYVRPAPVPALSSLREAEHDHEDDDRGEQADD